MSSKRIRPICKARLTTRTVVDWTIPLPVLEGCSSVGPAIVACLGFDDIDFRLTQCRGSKFDATENHGLVDVG